MGKSIFGLKAVANFSWASIRNSKRKNFLRMIPPSTNLVLKISCGLQDEGHGIVHHALGHFKDAFKELVIWYPFMSRNTNRSTKACPHRLQV